MQRKSFQDFKWTVLIQYQLQVTRVLFLMTQKIIGKEVPYHQTVRSLIHLATVIRPDLAYAISIVSENLEIPRTYDWCAVKRIFKYLKGTVNFGLLCQVKYHLNELKVYSDANYAGDI